MKSKSILVLAALLLVACVREGFLPDKDEIKTFDCFIVTVEDSPMTKVHMEDGGAVKWDVGDCIGVYSDMQAPVRFYRQADGQFRAENGEAVKGTYFYAYSPYDGFKYQASDPLCLTTENSGSIYVEGQEQWSLPMVAKGDDNQLLFKQVSGVLGFQVSASFPIEIIQLRTNDGTETLAGPCVIDLSQQKPMLTQTKIGEGYSNSIGRVNDVSFLEAKTVFFSLPASSRRSGVSLELSGNVPHSGEAFSFTKTTLKSFEIERGIIKTFPLIDLDKELGFTQFGKLSLSKEEVIVSHQSGSEKVQLTYGGRWKLSSDSAWCRVTPSEGTLDATLQIEVEENDGLEDRVATLTVFSMDDDQRAQIIVRQPSGAASSTDWRYRKFAHRSLLQKFTSVHCGYSPAFESLLDVVNAEFMRKCERMDAYGNMLASDPLSVAGIERLEALYVLDGYPFGFLDGRIQLKNCPDYSYFKEVFESAVLQQESLYPAASGVSFSSSLAGSVLSVDGTFYAHEAEEFKLSLFLLEDNVEHEGVLHNHVLRLSLGDILGDGIEISQKNTSRDFQYSASLPEGCNPENLSILVVTYRQYGNQRVERTMYYGDYYVDNCRRAKLGETVQLELYGYLDDGGNEGLKPGDEITF